MSVCVLDNPSSLLVYLFLVINEGAANKNSWLELT